ncbi:MAG: hypothetical protein AUG49_08500 [Catenulispora sp. 13_1_20CM_3_70_7]|nr:MAG: hypothetical protein AUG49_08500 [Catenulispora sp. 13_1_20CM_3_70_7]
MMRRCQHFCGCEGSPVGRDPDTGLLLCAACLGRSILGTDCSRARKHFGHMPVRSGEARWIEPLPLRDGDRPTMPTVFEAFVTIRTGFEGLAWDFLPLAWSAELAGTVASAGLTAASNPHRPPKDPPPGPLPPPPARPVQPNPPRR